MTFILKHPSGYNISSFVLVPKSRKNKTCLVTQSSVIFLLQILVKTCLNVMFITFRREKNKFLRIQDYCVVFAPCWLKSLFCYYYKVVFKLFISNVKLHPIDLTSITHAFNTLVNILNEIKFFPAID